MNSNFYKTIDQRNIDQGRPSGAIRRSILFSALDKYIVQGFAIVTMAVMARLLTPAETGLYLVAAGVLVLLEAFRDFGVGTYLVQRPRLSRHAVRTSFTVTFALSLGLGCALYLEAGSVAALLGDERLTRLLRIGALGFLLVPFGTPIVGLMRREMDFRSLAVLNVAGAAIMTITTIALGATGFGAESYVWGMFAGNAALTILAVRARPQLWIFRPGLAGWRQMLSFGMISSSVIFLNMAFDVLPRFALGRILGFDAVGLYGRALTLCQLPERAIASALSPVVLPAFAARIRARGDLKEAYLRGVTLITSVQWPALMLVALLAQPIVAVVLGDQWQAAAPLTRVVALGTMALTPAFLTFPLLVSLGRIRDTLTASLVSLPPSALLIIGAAPFGLDAVAASVLVTAPLQMAVAYHFVRRAIGLTWGDLWRAVTPSVLVTVGALVLPLAMVAWQPAGTSVGVPGAIVAVLGAGLGWAAVSFAIAHPLLKELRQLAELAPLWPLRRALPPQPGP